MANIRSAITNGSHVLAEVDHRSALMRRLRDLIALHTSDLGGADLVSESEQRLIRRAAMLTLQLEMLDSKFAAADALAGERDLDLYQKLSNTLRRLLTSLGLQRRAKTVTPSLDEYLASRSAAE